MKLSVIIPVYNEKNTVAMVAREALAVALPEPLKREIYH